MLVVEDAESRRNERSIPVATIYRFEPQHRGDKPRQVHQADREPQLVNPSAREPPMPAMEFGSAWYHDEAITHSNEPASHRCM